jgi:hypothetical protein
MSQNLDQLLERYVVRYGEPDKSLHFHYSVTLISKKNFKENDIFTVHAKINSDSKRIGWLFPLLILGSSEYDLFGDEHLIPYLQIAASYLSTNSVKVDDNTHILILKDATLLEGNVFSHDFLTSLLKYGYYNITSGVIAENSLFRINNDEIKKIKLTKCPAPSDYSKYINRLLCQLLPKVEDPLSRFVSIYQTIELLMEKYFHLRLDEHKKRRSTIGTIRENITDLSSERKLISGVFSHCELRFDLNENEMNLSRRLFESDKDETYYNDLKLPNFIYDTRNAIFHNYHKYELEDLMKDISERMEIILVELLENSGVSELLTQSSPQ